MARMGLKDALEAQAEPAQPDETSAPPAMEPTFSLIVRPLEDGTGQLLIGKGCSPKPDGTWVWESWIETPAGTGRYRKVW